MKRRIVQAACGIITLIVAGSCTTTAPRPSSINSAGAVEEVAFTEKPIRIYDKYDRAVPAIIHDLKQCAPVSKPSEGDLFQAVQWVIDYGIDLESRGTVDAEEATVQNEMYWKAIIALSANDITDAALDIFPKNPWALWELALDHLTYDFDGEELVDGRFDERYRLIRELDPHYELAYYQGQNTPEKRTAALALTQKVLPSLTKLFNGEDVLVSMRSLADGYLEMREYEFAIYAYKYILFRTYDDGFDQAIIRQISVCLQNLGMERVIPFVDQFLSEVERMITPERERIQAVRGSYFSGIS
jgi:hypothetical protein